MEGADTYTDIVIDLLEVEGRLTAEEMDFLYAIVLAQGVYGPVMEATWTWPEEETFLLSDCLTPCQKDVIMQLGIKYNIL